MKNNLKNSSQQRQGRSILIALIIVIISFMAILPLASASDVQSLPSQKQGEDIILWQSCSNSTYCNISSLIIRNLKILNETSMNQITTDYYELNITNSSIIGKYVVVGHCDENAIDKRWAYDFDVTTSGYNSNNTNFNIIIIALLGLIIVLFIFAYALHNEHGFLSFAFAGIGFYLLTPLVHIAKIVIENNYVDLGLSGMIGTAETILTWLDYALIVYIIVYIFVKVISNYGQEKQAKLEGLR